MQFSAVILAFVAAVSAQTADFDPIYMPASGQVLTAGETFDITWEAPAPYDSADDLITIKVLQGETTDTLQVGDTVATGVANTQETYSWTIPSTYGSYPTYGLIFYLESNTSTLQYSNPFHITSVTSTTGSSSSLSATSTVTMHISTGSAYIQGPLATSSAKANATTTYHPAYNTTSALVSASPAPIKNATTLASSMTYLATTTGAASTVAGTTTAASATHSATGGAASMAKGGVLVLAGMVMALAL